MNTERSNRLALIDKIGRDIARLNANDVDVNARCPIETVNALREAGVFALSIPAEFGGAGADPFELAEGCYLLAQHCSSSAAVLAMHHTQMLSIVHHVKNNPQWDEYLRRAAKENRLIASVTSEMGTSGDMRRSECAVEITDSGYDLFKNATTLSYGSYADDLLITARRSKESAGGDQVLILAERGNFELTDIGEWDTLGMRGTCSAPAKVRARGEKWQIMETPFADISTFTMVPTSHIFWAASWYGLACDAVRKSREILRSKARSSPGNIPMGAHRVVDLVAALQSMEFEVFGMAREYSEALARQDWQKLAGMGFALRINSLKLNASRTVVQIVNEALSTSGIQSYKNNSPYALGRHLRDAQAALMQINNDRIQQTNASMLLVHKGN